MYGIRQCNRKKISGEIGAFFTEIFFKFQLWYWIKNLHYQIFKFVIDNSDISLNCLQHIQKRRNFDAKVTCHQPICLLLHAILSGVGVQVPLPRPAEDHHTQQGSTPAPEGRGSRPTSSRTSRTAPGDGLLKIAEQPSSAERPPSRGLHMYETRRDTQPGTQGMTTVQNEFGIFNVISTCEPGSKVPVSFEKDRLDRVKLVFTYLYVWVSIIIHQSS